MTTRSTIRRRSAGQSPRSPSSSATVRSARAMVDIPPQAWMNRGRVASAASPSGPTAGRRPPGRSPSVGRLAVGADGAVGGQRDLAQEVGDEGGAGGDLVHLPGGRDIAHAHQRAQAGGRGEAGVVHAQGLLHLLVGVDGLVDMQDGAGRGPPVGLDAAPRVAGGVALGAGVDQAPDIELGRVGEQTDHGVEVVELGIGGDDGAGAVGSREGFLAHGTRVSQRVPAPAASAGAGTGPGPFRAGRR